MAVNKDALKKHHFWVLVGLTPLLVLLSFIMVSTGVGAKIAQRNKDIDKAKGDFKGKTNPKSNVLIERFGSQQKVLDDKQTVLWKDNWERQIGLHAKNVNDKTIVEQDVSRNLLRWPISPKLNGFNYTANYKNQLKFGDQIPDDGGIYDEFRVRKEVYLAEFSNPYLKDIAREPEKRTGMADAIYPTEFAGGWSAVLRHVNEWGNIKPTSEQIWLALEDIWVQRALLDAIKTVNVEVGAFHRVPPIDAKGTKLEETPFQRGFQSRIWRLTLKAAPRASDGRVVLSGAIQNVTDRLQLLGAGNTMILNVWLSAAPNAQPIPFRIGGEFIAGGSAVEIKPSDEHVLPPGTPVEEIARVEQVFDSRTVPIRRVDRLVLGKRDSRYASFGLLMPRFASFKKLEDDAKAAEEAKTSSASSGGNAMYGGSGSKMTSPGGSGPPGSGDKTAAAGPVEGGGDVATVLDGSRKRYVDVTDQIRRMPVAIVVVVDQAYMQDLLVAYANSQMRFQITQMHWKRFRGSLGETPGGSGSSGGYNSGSSGSSFGAARGTEGSGITYGSNAFGPSRPRGPMPMGGSSGGPPKGGSAGGPPNGSQPSGSAYGPSGGSLDNNGGLTTLSDGQLTSGLVELSVYGVITLYEKYVEETKPAQ